MAQQHGGRAYSVSDWQRDFARAFAAAIPLEAQRTQARGALLAADNDEPELEHQLCDDCDTAFDCKMRGCKPKVPDDSKAVDPVLERMREKAQREAQYEYERALNLQIQHQGRTGEICR